MNVKSKNIVKLLIFIMLITLSLGNSIKGIDNAREDLGMLDSLKLTNEWGTEITEGSTLHNGSRYTLKYKFSLDDPSIDYKNKVAKIQLPAIFKPMSISPSTMPLIYNDGSQDQEIGTITCDLATGELVINFNDNAVFGTKSNINGWLSLSAILDAQTGNNTITVDWTGNNETSIGVDIDDGITGTDKVAIINKYVTSGTETSSQPTVQQDANGKFYVKFNIEVFISKDYPNLKLKDTIYANMKLDDTSIKVISREKDGQEYYSPSNIEYKNSFDAWTLANSNTPKAAKLDITSDLINENKITSSSDGFEINFDNVDYNQELKSRQLTTSPLQLRYNVSYNVFLSGIDPNLTLEQAQLAYEKQEARNNAVLSHEGSTQGEVNWIKPALGGGATGEQRKVKLIKVDSITKEELNGAEFNLYKKSNYSSDFELYKSDIKVENGSIEVEGLIFGTYHFVETKAPIGYILQTEAFPDFIVDQNTPITEFKISLENKRVQDYVGGLEIIKVNEENERLKDAEFKLYKKDGTFVEALKTDTNGKASSKSNLALGEYYIVETKASSGYILSEKKYVIKIEANLTEKIVVTIVNVKSKIVPPVNVKLPRSGADITLLTITMLVGLTTIGFVRKIKKI